MVMRKTKGVTLRLEPAMWELAQAVAAVDRRSMTSVVELGILAVARECGVDPAKFGLAPTQDVGAPFPLNTISEA